MSVMNDMKRAEQMDKLFTPERWGKDPYPAGPDGLDENGRWSETFKTDYKLENARVGEYNGTPILNVKLKVADPGHNAVNDTCELSWFLRADELADPEGFVQKRNRRDFGDLIKLMQQLDILPADWDSDSYEQAVSTVCEKWPELDGRFVEAAIVMSVYRKKDSGEIKGPYANVSYWKKSDFDKGPQDTPF